MIRIVAVLALTPLAALAPSPARADGGDTVYGRFDGDLVVAMGMGGGAAIGDRRSGSVTATTTLELRARVLDTAGLLIAPEWRAEAGSRVVIAVDLRPLFLLRWFLNQESGDLWLDLFVDSIGMELGAAIAPLDEEAGLGLAMGGGVDVPIVIRSRIAGGLFLRIAVRWVGARPLDALAPRGGIDDLAILGVLTVRGIVDLGLARAEPPRYRTRDPEATEGR